MSILGWANQAARRPGGMHVELRSPARSCHFCVMHGISLLESFGHLSSRSNQLIILGIGVKIEVCRGLQRVTSREERADTSRLNLSSFFVGDVEVESLHQ